MLKASFFYELSLFILGLGSCTQTKINNRVYQTVKYELENNLNTFNGCIIRIINFSGRNLNGFILQQPILLMRYLSFPKTFTIYPYELQNNYSAVERFFRHEKYLVYMQASYNNHFIVSNKIYKCEAEVFLEPPKNNKDNSMFQMDEVYHSLKHPYQIWHEIVRHEENWRNRYINTVQIFTVLVTSSTIRNNECSSYLCNAWMNSAWIYQTNIKPNQYLMVWEISSRIRIFIHCKFCDPCNPSMVQELAISLSFFLQSISKVNSLLMYQRNPVSIEIVLPRTILVAATYNSIHTNRNVMLNYLNQVQLLDWHHIEFCMHPFFMRSIIPRNVSLDFVYQFPADRFQYKMLNRSQCKSNSRVNYSPNLRLRIHRYYDKHAAQFPNIGLMFTKQKLGFVSCHRVAQSWLLRFQELVSPFDYTTWFLLLFLVISMAKLISYNCPVLNINSEIPMGEALFGLFAVLLERDHKIFEWSAKDNRSTSYFLVISLSFSLLVLSNEYRGDNITRMTVEPELLSFDNFTDLVQNGFQIYSLPLLLGKYDFSLLPLLARSKPLFYKTSAHEYFPIVSELWYMIMLQWYPFSTLDNSKEKISRKTWFYLNHSQLYYMDWITMFSLDMQTMIKSATLSLTNSYAWAYEHLSKCDKSALIMEESQALVIYTNLSRHGAPAFWGKDVIFQTLYGYALDGQFPLHLIKRFQVFFQSGIQKWFEKYCKLLLVRKTNLQVYNSPEWRNKPNVTVGVLWCVPGFGLLVCFILFIWEYKKLTKRKLLACIAQQTKNFVLNIHIC